MHSLPTQSAVLIELITAKCTRCGASATGETLDEARQLINHAAGLSRGIKCGDNWNKVIEVKEESPKTVTKKVPEKIPEVIKPEVSKPVSNKPKKSKTY